MPKIGRQTRIGLGRESIPGTPVTASQWLLVNVADAFDVPVHESNNAGLGNLTDAYNGRKVKNMSQWNLEGDLSDHGVGPFLLGVLGAVAAPVTLETGVYSHVFSESNVNNKPSYTAYLNDPDNEERAAYCMVNNLELNFVAGAKGAWRAQLMGRPLSDQSSTPTIPTENQLDTQDLTLEYATTYAGLGSGTQFNVKEFKLMIDNGVADYMTNGSVEPAAFYNQTFRVSGSFVLNYENDTIRDFVRQDTKRAIRIHVENVSSLIGATEYPSLTIDLARVAFTNFEVGRGLDEIATITVSFTAEYSISDSLTMQATLVNTRSTTY